MESNKKNDDQESCKQSASLPFTFPSCHGPRTVLIHRTENGFGFTLRHFIVYPPDVIQVEKTDLSINKENNENVMSSESHTLEPMDTIFVKHIREGGPAHRAGLATGDRIVSVNGETISGKSYSEVVQLIQKSKSNLQLLVVPKEDDILQLYFPGTAYHGATSSNSCGTSDPNEMYKKISSDFRNFHAFPSTTFSSSSSSSLSSLSNPHFDESSSKQKSFLPCISRQNGEMRRDETKEWYKIENDSQNNCTPFASSNFTSQDRSNSPMNMVTNPSDLHEVFPFKCDPYLSMTTSYQQNSDTNYSRHPLNVSKHNPKTLNYNGADIQKSQSSQTSISWENASHNLPSNSHLNSGFSKNLYSCHKTDTSKQYANNHFHETKKCQSKEINSSDDPKTVCQNKVWCIENDKAAERLRQSLEKKEKFLLKSHLHEDSSKIFPQPSMFILNHESSREFRPQIVNQFSWPRKCSELKIITESNFSPSIQTQDISHKKSSQVSEKSLPTSYDNNKTFQSHIISGIGCVKFQTTSNPNKNPDRTLSVVNESPSSSSVVSNTDVTLFHNHVSLNNKNKPSCLSQHKVVSPKRSSSFLRKASSLDSDVPKPRALRSIENQKVLQFQLVSQRTKQFESGSVDDEAKNRTNLYRNELCRLTSKCQTPSVSLRTAQFESLSSSQDTCSSEENGHQATVLKQKQEKQDFKWQRSYSDSVSCGLSSCTTMAEGGEPNSPGVMEKNSNCLLVPSIPIPSRKPLLESQQNNLQTSDTAETDHDSLSRLSFEPMSADEEEFPIKKVVRQNSYLQAVQSPYKGASNIAVSSLAVTVSSTTSTTNSITTTSTKTTNCTSLMGPYFALAGIVSERKAFYEDEPFIAGIISSKSRSQKYDDGYLDKGEETNKSETPFNRAQNIQKLKAFFGEKTPQIIEATERHTSSLSTPDILKEGLLHCKTILIDGKRSTDRSWKQFWGCLRGSILYLHRDKFSQQLTSPDEQALALKPVSADVAHTYTKRKNVFQLIASNDTEYLLQAEDNEEMQDWIYYIQNHCSSENMNVDNHLTSPRLVEHTSRLSPQPIQKGIKKLTSFRNRSPTNQSPLVKNRKTIHGDDIVPKAKTWKGKMVKTIKKIHGTSTTSTAPPEGVTISVPLEDCPPSSINEFVPLFVELCTSIVEARGLEMVGIYRVPGNTAAVSALLDAVNKGFDDLNLQDPRWNDVNVISSMLKAFFRKLPDPLITSDLYPYFIAANKIEDYSQKLFAIKKLLRELPDYHYESLKFLIKHLRKIAAYSIINKMEPRNLAIVFGPTLIRAADDNMATMVTDMSHQCCIVETLINKAEWFFDDENEYNWEFSDKNMPGSNVSEQKETPSNEHLINITSNLDSASNSDAVNAKEIIASIIAAANEVSRNKAKKFSVCSAPDISEHLNCEVPVINRKLEYGTTSQQPLLHGQSRFFNIDSREGDPSSQNFHSGKRTASADSLNKYQDPPRRITEEKLDQNIYAASNNHGITNYGTNSTHRNVCSGEVLRTYSGLSANTQERIRRFEMETRALLQRDLNRQQKENEQRQAERERIELEWQKAKHELEQDDPLDVLADNLSSPSTKCSGSITSSLSRYRMNPLKANGNLSSAILRSSCTKQALANRKTHFFYETPENEAKMKNVSCLKGRDRIRTHNNDSKQAPDSFTNLTSIPSQNNPDDHQFGSVDSLQGFSERSLSSLTSSEESDLMSSITATLNHRLSKLRNSNTILNSGNTLLKQKDQIACNEPLSLDTSPVSTKDNYCPFRDPSLHRNQESNTYPRTKAYNEHLNQINKNIQDSVNMLQKKSVSRHPNTLSLSQNLTDCSSTLQQSFSSPNEKEVTQQCCRDHKIVSGNGEKTEPNGDEDESHITDVQIHRNEHTLITATVSTTGHTVTTSGTTAVITATIVTTASTKKISDRKETSLFDTENEEQIDKLKNQKDITNNCEKNFKGLRTYNSSTASNENSKLKLPFPSLAYSTVPANKVKQNSLKRRHTVGGTKDFDKFDFLVCRNIPFKDSQLSAWERLQPETSECEINIPQRTMKHWLERERLRMSFPNLTPVKIPIEF